MRHLNFSCLIFTLLTSSLSWALQAPDFTLTVQKKPRGLQLVAAPPAGNHINIQAPMYLQREGTAERTRPSSAEEKKVVFTLPTGAGGTYVIHLFLCDDQKTYCEAHQVKFVSENPGATTSQPAAPKKKNTSSKKMEKKMENGFLLNRPDEALALAAHSKKPLIIDFFGIWCPPCNMLDEEIFSTGEFQKATSQFVKLKLDADAEVSWKLKARYRIGGYPTVIFADSHGDEILRVVGYLRKPGFLAKVNEAWESRDLSEPNPIREGLVHLERREFEKALLLLKDAPTHREEYALAEIGFWGEKKAKEQGPSPADTGLITALEHAIEALPNSPLSLEWRQNLAELYSKKNPEKEKIQRSEAIHLAHELLAHPEKLEKYELTQGDVWASIAQMQETGLDTAKSKVSWRKAAEAYGKFATSPQERGNQLERAYCLRKAGDYSEAEALYQRLESFYPEEVTFFNAHASMELERKNLVAAEDLAKKAFKFSYGNNKLKLSLLLGKIYQAAGKNAEAIQLIQNTLKAYQAPESEMARAKRTLEPLKELLAKLMTQTKDRPESK